MKVGKRAPEATPPPSAEVRARRDRRVADLVRRADTSAAAWETFGQAAPTTVVEKARAARAEMLLQAVQALSAQIGTGRKHVEALNGAPVPPAWVERFVELHTQRLELTWKADAATFRYPDWDAEAARVCAVTDEEVSKALGPAWPGEEVQGLMTGLDWAADAGRERLEEACRALVAAAVRQRYAGVGD